jgi:hypothetical protein
MNEQKKSVSFEDNHTKKGGRGKNIENEQTNTKKMHTVVVISTGEPGTIDVGNGFVVDGSGKENSLCPSGALCFWEGDLKLYVTIRRADEAWSFRDGNHYPTETRSFSARDGATIWIRKIWTNVVKGQGAGMFAVDTASAKAKRTCCVCEKPALWMCSCCDRCYVYCSQKCAEMNWVPNPLTLGMKHAEAARAETANIPRRTTAIKR